MNNTNQTLLEQMMISDIDIDDRKNILFFSNEDVQNLLRCRSVIEQYIDDIVSEFYSHQTQQPEISLLIGDLGTLEKLMRAQRTYILDMFSGEYDSEYVNNRLRIGLVHKRIGVSPKLYLAAIHYLKTIIFNYIKNHIDCKISTNDLTVSIDKIFLFDVTLVFEMYIKSMVSEVDVMKDRAENYAKSLEDKVRNRTKQLEEMARTDSLTGLLNVRSLDDFLGRALKAAQRRSEPLTIIYFDVNDFKKVNDSFGHQRGDDILRVIGSSLRSIARVEDGCFRYGGDEFCIVLSNCSGSCANDKFLGRLREKLDESDYDISISCGVYQTGPDEYLDPKTLIKMADERMYIAKKAFKEMKKEPS
jgi:diguanylate cyclase (GGDEF)-like protein